MYCPKCGSDLNEDIICSNCSYDTNERPQNDIDNSILNNNFNKNLRNDSNEEPKNNINTSNITTDTADSSNNIKKDNKAFIAKKSIYIFLSILVLALFFISAKKVSSIGQNISSIKSVGGKTLEEAYYFEIGNLYQILASVIKATGIFFSSVLLWLGLYSK